MNTLAQSSGCLLILFALTGCSATADRTAIQGGRQQAFFNDHQRPNCDVPNPPPACDPSEPGDPDPSGFLNSVNIERQQIFNLSNGQTFSLPAIARFSGWARDRDVAGSIKVRLAHNGTVLKDIDANQAGTGNQAGHYFADSASWVPVVGSNALCATALNAGPGEDTLLGCQTWEIDAPPEVPGILGLTRTGVNVGVRWEDRSTNEQHFYVERYVIGGGYSTIASPRAMAGTGTVTATADTTSAPDDLRCYRLQVLSTFYRVYSTDSCLPNTVPSPPMIADLLPSAKTMSVWFTVAYDSAVDFRFERRAPNGTWANANLSVSSGQAGGPRAAIDRTVNPQTVYCYRVIALNRFGESAGTEACKSTLRPALPTPSELRVTSKSTSSLNLAWTDQAVDETFYQVIYRVKDAPISEPIVILPASPATGPMALELPGLRAGTEYCVSVMARAPDAEERNGASICGQTESVVSISAFAVSPTAVQFCAARQVALSWNVASATKVIISRGGTVILNRNGPGGSSSWQDTFVDPTLQDGTGGDIGYSVQAFGAGGSTVSRQASVRSLTDFPIASALVFVNNSSRNVVLQRLDASFVWNDVRSIPASSFFTVQFDRCATTLFRVVDRANGTIPWEMTTRVLGFPGWPVFQAAIN